MLLQDRLTLGKQRLDNALDTLVLLCEPVEPPKGELEHIHYFCGNTEIAADLQEREPRRAMIYKSTVGLVRAYANIADELERAGYSAGQGAHIKSQVDHFLNVREIVRKASGESLDLKAAGHPTRKVGRMARCAGPRAGGQARDVQHPWRGSRR